MCSSPPLPPPMPLLMKTSLITNTRRKANTGSLFDLRVCEWTPYTELREACARKCICLRREPFRHQYRHYESMLQQGPTCGLVALSMLISGEVNPYEMMHITSREGYSNNGEMYSCRNMAKLAKEVLRMSNMSRISVSLRKGGLYTQDSIERLLNGAALLVPYDSDHNYEPCLKRGHRAHWALVCGVIIIDDPGDSYVSDPSNVYVLCRQGKSRLLSVWRLDLLDASNKNLVEFCPARECDGMTYVLPEGGIDGDNGLNDQYILFEEL